MICEFREKRSISMESRFSNIFFFIIKELWASIVHWNNSHFMLELETADAHFRCIKFAESHIFYFFSLNPIFCGPRFEFPDLKSPNSKWSNSKHSKLKIFNLTFELSFLTQFPQFVF